MAIKVDHEAWYSADETAELMGVSPKTLESARIKGDGCPYSKIGRRIYYKGSDLLSHIEGARRSSTAARPFGGRAA